jgi:hypothetical protein
MGSITRDASSSSSSPLSRFDGQQSTLTTNLRNSYVFCIAGASEVILLAVVNGPVLVLVVASE